ncbi:hypothetical protein [Bacteroides faecalis]
MRKKCLFNTIILSVVISLCTAATADKTKALPQQIILSKAQY